MTNAIDNQKSNRNNVKLLLFRHIVLLNIEITMTYVSGLN